jgi:hypothetical protein
LGKKKDCLQQKINRQNHSGHNLPVNRNLDNRDLVVQDQSREAKFSKQSGITDATPDNIGKPKSGDSNPSSRGQQDFINDVGEEALKLQVGALKRQVEELKRQVEELKKNRFSHRHDTYQENNFRNSEYANDDDEPWID